MNETKIKALQKQIDSGQIKTDAARILDFVIENAFATAPEICKQLKMPEKTVSARCAGLQDLGILEVMPMKYSDFQIYTHQPVKKLQIYNAYKRKEAKFKQWKKRGLKEFPEFLREINYNLLNE
jgi:predicted DNA-binding transcriptional regulator